MPCSPDLGDWFAQQWEGIEQVFRLERTVRLLKTTQRRHYVVYGLSRLSMRQAPPQRMLWLVRGHWAIENKLHYRRDVGLGEDACQTRTGPVPGLLAQPGSTVLSFMDRVGEGLVARQMRSFDAHLEQALALVLDFLLFRVLAVESPAGWGEPDKVCIYTSVMITARRS